jgi:hypothetical protein
VMSAEATTAKNWREEGILDSVDCSRGSKT